MGSDLENLKSIAQDDQIRQLLGTVIIKDDIDRLDPWTAAELPSAAYTYVTWPRDESGKVDTSQIGLADLTQMLRARLLQPTMIKIRDHRPNEGNLDYLSFFPELDHLQPLMRPSPSSNSTPHMARDLLDGVNVALTSLAILPADSGSLIAGEPFWAYMSMIGNPDIGEAVLGLSYEVQGQTMNMSILPSATLSLDEGAASYWLEKVFYEATALKSLELQLPNLEAVSLTAEKVIPALACLKLRGAYSTSTQQILAMIASSKDSLTNIDFRQVGLSNDSTWQEVLSTIARDYQALVKFTLRVLRENATGSPALDFHKLNRDDIPPECRDGLILDERGPEMRLVRVSYDGPKAGTMLQILNECGYVPTKEQLEYRRANGPPNWRELTRPKTND